MICRKAKQLFISEELLIERGFSLSELERDEAKLRDFVMRHATIRAEWISTGLSPCRQVVIEGLPHDAEILGFERVFDRRGVVCIVEAESFPKVTAYDWWQLPEVHVTVQTTLVTSHVVTGFSGVPFSYRMGFRTGRKP